MPVSMFDLLQDEKSLRLFDNKEGEERGWLLLLGFLSLNKGSGEIADKLTMW